jgi:hypothetical protein
VPPPFLLILFDGDVDVDDVGGDDVEEVAVGEERVNGCCETGSGGLSSSNCVRLRFLRGAAATDTKVP